MVSILRLKVVLLFRFLVFHFCFHFIELHFWYRTNSFSFVAWMWGGWFKGENDDLLHLYSSSATTTPTKHKKWLHRNTKPPTQIQTSGETQSHQRLVLHDHVLTGRHGDQVLDSSPLDDHFDDGLKGTEPDLWDADVDPWERPTERKSFFTPTLEHLLTHKSQSQLYCQFPNMCQTNRGI